MNFLLVDDVPEKRERIDGRALVGQSVAAGDGDVTFL